MAPFESTHSISESFQHILDSYSSAREGKDGPFSSNHALNISFRLLVNNLAETESVKSRTNFFVNGSTGKGNWAGVPWIAFMDRRVTTTTQKGVYVVFLFRQDMSGVYITLNQGVTELSKIHGVKGARLLLKKRAESLYKLIPEKNHSDFQRGEGIDLHAKATLGLSYEYSTAAYKLYEPNKIPPDSEIIADLDVLLSAYASYYNSDLYREFNSTIEEPTSQLQNRVAEESTSIELPEDFSSTSAFKSLLEYVSNQGYLFEPWQIAQYVAALKTKPFVILAGITGTGKSKLPRLIEEATGGQSELVPVRPDWTDSSEVLGYIDLVGGFRPGRILEVAHRASVADDTHHTLIVDEMNIARVEYYFAEVLSRIEDRHPASSGGWESSPLVQLALSPEDAEWGNVRFPANLALVGTVNMDESTHSFSRKVLDRAFTIELSEVFLGNWQGDKGISPGNRRQAKTQSWPVSFWQPEATRLSELRDITVYKKGLIDQVIENLTALNKILSPAQLQIGYRSRDEIALFILHADSLREFFKTSDGDVIEPLDLAIQMKVLPRISGGHSGVRRVLLGILGWAMAGVELDGEDDARPIVKEWEELGRPNRFKTARLPGVVSRTCLMWERLRSEGFTSYWL